MKWSKRKRRRREASSPESRWSPWTRLLSLGTWRRPRPGRGAAPQPPPAPSQSLTGMRSSPVRSWKRTQTPALPAGYSLVSTKTGNTSVQANLEGHRDGCHQRDRGGDPPPGADTGLWGALAVGSSGAALSELAGLVPPTGGSAGTAGSSHGHDG